MTLIPDEGIQKVTVLKTELPKITKDGKYYVRYRVTSEDGNKISSWSPKYEIQKDPVSSATSTDKTILNPEGTVSAKYSISYVTKSHGESFDISWTITNSSGVVEIPEALSGLDYDTYASWSLNNSTWTDWELVSTTKSNSFSVPIPTAYISTASQLRYAKFMIHLSTVTKDVDDQNYQTLLLKTSSITTKAYYNSTSIV
jgi:hypothetical protein